MLYVYFSSRLPRSFKFLHSTQTCCRILTPRQPLKSLSHSKIHLVTSSASAELTYARYVYSHTAPSDSTIRKPVASFWGQRSHVLRHETEGSFRQMCLEYPEFAFDVLSFVLDAEEKRMRARRGEEEPRSARKRARA